MEWDLSRQDRAERALQLLDSSVFVLMDAILSTGRLEMDHGFRTTLSDCGPGWCVLATFAARPSGFRV
jgi:hypothetical protein